MRSPAVLASSIATIEGLAPGRALLALGVGDTAVRLMGKRPSRVAELEQATTMARALLAGDKVEVGAARPRRSAPCPSGACVDRSRWATHASHGWGAWLTGVFIRGRPPSGQCARSY